MGLGSGKVSVSVSFALPTCALSYRVFQSCIFHLIFDCAAFASAAFSVVPIKQQKFTATFIKWLEDSRKQNIKTNALETVYILTSQTLIVLLMLFRSDSDALAFFDLAA